LGINLANKDFLTLKDFSSEEIVFLVDLSIKLKSEKLSGIHKNRLKNKSIAMIFEKTSTRTRCATSVACFDEGGHAEFLGKADIQMGKKESIKDTARVLGRMFDAILFRGFKQKVVEELSKYSGIPVINGLTDEYHPTQIIADLMTIKEIYGKLEGINLVFLGDGKNNVSNSLLIGAAKSGMNITISSPKDFLPKKDLLTYLDNVKKSTGSVVKLVEDPSKAVKDADVIYTDVWVSMGEEKDTEKQNKINSLKKYRVDSKIMNSTGKDSTIFLHCLPATHDGGMHHMEVTEEVFESDRSYVFDQAENRLHTIKAILVALIGGLD